MLAIFKGANKIKGTEIDGFRENKKLNDQRGPKKEKSNLERRNYKNNKELEQKGA